MRIESGPTLERRIRTFLMFLMFAAGGVWFAYDGWVGYAAANFKEHLERLPAGERQQARTARVYPAIIGREEIVKQARDVLKKPDLAGQRRALEASFGGPPSYENADAWHYFGPAFGLKFPIQGGRLQDVITQPTQKTDDDIRWQKRLAVVVLLVALILLGQLVRVFRTRLVLDETGLTYRGKATVGWDQMKSLHAAEFTKKGWVDLVYDADGLENKLRLDEYHLARFAQIIDETCRRKGLVNPLAAEKTEVPKSA